MRIDLSKLPIFFEGDGTLRRGPLRAKIRHIQENGTPWPEMIGACATSRGAGKYQVGPMVVEVEPYRHVVDGKCYGCDENWEPILTRPARAA